MRAFLQVDVVGMVRKKMRVGREGKREECKQILKDVGIKAG